VESPHVIISLRLESTPNLERLNFNVLYVAMGLGAIIMNSKRLFSGAGCSCKAAEAGGPEDPSNLRSIPIEICHRYSQMRLQFTVTPKGKA
jgi:hypothetical protein